MSREAKLEALGFPLERVPKSAAIYRPVVVHRSLAYVSGCLPFDGPDRLVSPGKLGRDLSLADGQRAAALCAANILRLVHDELGTLERVERMLHLRGYVHCTEDFTEQHLVINGASQLLAEVLGDAGSHARTALGLSQLPFGSSVEVDAVIAVKA